MISNIKEPELAGDVIISSIFNKGRCNYLPLKRHLCTATRFTQQQPMTFNWKFYAQIIKGETSVLLVIVCIQEIFSDLFVVAKYHPQGRRNSYSHFASK